MRTRHARARREAFACAGVAACALALGACGSDDSGEVTIPQGNAEELLAALDDIRASVEEGDCTAARTNASQFQDAVFRLPAEVGAEAKAALREGARNLEELVETECEVETGATGAEGVEPTTTEPIETTAPTTTTTTTTETDQGPPDEQPGRGGGRNGPPGPSGNDGGDDEDSGGVGAGED